MSFDLYVWKGPIVRTGEDAGRLLDQAFPEDAGPGETISPFDPSKDVANFYNDLIERYPPLEAFSEADLANGAVETLWSVSPERSDRLVAMYLRWGAPDEAIDFIAERARRHALVLYDPQGSDVHLPDDPLTRDEEWPPFRARDAVRAAVAGILGLVIAAVAWRLGILIISGLAAVIGLFLFVMSIYTFVVEARRRFWGIAPPR
jgi:hypothetical protein